MIKKVIAVLVTAMFCLPVLASGEWRGDTVNNVTVYMQTCFKAWTEQDSLKMLEESTHSGEYSTMVVGEKTCRVKIVGETVLINGKDISGNLGSKTTYGNNSPIIEGNGNIVNSNNNNSEILKKK